MKKWIGRTVVATVSALAVVIGGAVPAHAGDVRTLLYYNGYLVASIEFIDDGDLFVLTDWHADGYGPDGYLLRDTISGWEYVKSVHNSKGYKNAVTFTYNITSSYVYKMKVCRTGAGCKYSAEFTE